MSVCDDEFAVLPVVSRLPDSNALSGNAGVLSDDVLRQTAEQAKAAAAKVTHDARVDPADLQKVYRESGNAGAVGRTMKIKPLFAWYDLWVGAFWDRKGRKLYILPVPCIGVVIQFGRHK
jgi:hypothetical protein